MKTNLITISLFFLLGVFGKHGYGTEHQIQTDYEVREAIGEEYAGQAGAESGPTGNQANQDKITQLTTKFIGEGLSNENRAALIEDPALRDAFIEAINEKMRSPASEGSPEIGEKLKKLLESLGEEEAQKVGPEKIAEEVKRLREAQLERAKQGKNPAESPVFDDYKLSALTKRAAEKANAGNSTNEDGREHARAVAKALVEAKAAQYLQKAKEAVVRATPPPTPLAQVEGRKLVGKGKERFPISVDGETEYSPVLDKNGQVVPGIITKRVKGEGFGTVTALPAGYQIDSKGAITKGNATVSNGLVANGAIKIGDDKYAVTYGTPGSSDGSRIYSDGSGIKKVSQSGKITTVGSAQSGATSSGSSSSVVNVSVGDASRALTVSAVSDAKVVTLKVPGRETPDPDARAQTAARDMAAAELLMKAASSTASNLRSWWGATPTTAPPSITQEEFSNKQRNAWSSTERVSPGTQFSVEGAQYSVVDGSVGTIAGAGGWWPQRNEPITIVKGPNSKHYYVGNPPKRPADAKKVGDNLYLIPVTNVGGQWSTDGKVSYP